MKLCTVLSSISIVSHGWFWDKSPVEGLSRYMTDDAFDLLIVLRTTFKTPPVTDESYPLTPFQRFLENIPYASQCRDCDKLPLIMNEIGATLEMQEGEFGSIVPLINFPNGAPTAWAMEVIGANAPPYLFQLNKQWAGSNGYIYADHSYLLAMMGERPIQGTQANLYENGGMVAGMVLLHYWDRSQSDPSWGGTTTIMMTMDNADPDTHFWYGHFVENYVSLLFINNSPSYLIQQKTAVVNLKEHVMASVLLKDGDDGHVLIDGAFHHDFARRLKPAYEFVLTPASAAEKDFMGNSAEAFMGDSKFIEEYAPFTYPIIKSDRSEVWQDIRYKVAKARIDGVTDSKLSYESYREYEAKNLTISETTEGTTCGSDLNGLRVYRLNAFMVAPISTILGVCSNGNIAGPDESFSAQFSCPENYTMDGIMQSYDRSPTSVGIYGLRVVCVLNSTKNH